MKNLVKLLGIIAFVAVIGFSTVSCHRTVLDVIDPDDYSPTTGTVKVNNISISDYDTNVTMYLCNSSGTVLNTVTGVNRNQYAYWYNVSSGTYIVRARDSLNYVYNSTSFYLSAGQNKVLNYNGSSIY